MITSTRNKRVAEAVRLKKRGLREQDRRFLVEGAQATGEALGAGAAEAVYVVPGSAGRVPEVAAAAAGGGVEVHEVSEAVMAHLTSAVTPQGIVAVAGFVDVPVDRLPVTGMVPVLCSVRDPGNAGTVLRSADAAGAAGLVFTKGSVDVYNQKTVRASAGSLFHLPVAREVEAPEAVAALRAHGARILAADPEGDRSMYEEDLSGPTGLLLGNEAWGLPDEVRSLADGTVRVPIHGRAESLNLAAAAVLLMFEAGRQRGGETGGDLAAVIDAFAHDLRLPLTALKGFANTLVDRWERFDDGARRELVAGMLLDLDRVAATVALVVEAARMERGRSGPAPQRHRVAPVLASLTTLFERSPDYPAIEATGDAVVSVDPIRLHAILLVMCEGALWWGREGPIVVRAGEEGGRTVIDVIRTGEPPAEPESAFAGPGSEGGKIGLHVARRMVEALGGTLVMEGADAEVRLRLMLPV